MDREKTETLQFLNRWHGGDPRGLEDLIARHLPWVRQHVRRRLGPLLRKKGESSDYVQDAMMEFLRYGPRVLISDDRHFRALMVQIVENGLRNKHDGFMAQRRAVSRERPLPSDTVLVLDPPRETVKTPSLSVQRHEREAWIRLGMELLDPQDQEVLVLQKWEGRSFVEIGNRLEISPDAARMRHNRAVDRLTEVVHKLRRGDLDTINALEADP